MSIFALSGKKPVVSYCVLFLCGALLVAADGVAQTRSAELNNAIQAYKNNDYLTATRVFKKHAQLGNAISQRYLGEMYDKGLGLPQDYKKAVNWYRKAAIQKDPAAQYLLGVKFANGHGVSENNKSAYMWFALAFDNGYKLAASPLKVLNRSMSTRARQEALILAVEFRRGTLKKELIP